MRIEEASENGFLSPREHPSFRGPEDEDIHEGHDDGEAERPGDDLVRAKETEEEFELPANAIGQRQGLDDDHDLP